MDLFLIYGLIIVFLLSLLIYLIDKVINRKKEDKKKYSFIRRYPLILFILLFIFGIIYLMRINAYLRIIFGVMIISLPLGGLLYYIRSLDKNTVKNNFVLTYLGVTFLLMGGVILLMFYMYNVDLEDIKLERKPTYASSDGIFYINKKSCGTEVYDGIGYRVEYCSTNTANKDNYRIGFWFDNKWEYEFPNNQNDNKWCKCGE